MNKSVIGAVLVSLVLLAGGALFFTSTNKTPSSDNELRIITATEVAMHNTKEDCWTIINSNVYDLTSFVSNHVGGDEILRACGEDATTLFTTRTTEDGATVGSGTPHSQSAESQLKSLIIGRL